MWVSSPKTFMSPRTNFLGPHPVRLDRFRYVITYSAGKFGTKGERPVKDTGMEALLVAISTLFDV